MPAAFNVGDSRQPVGQGGGYTLVFSDEFDRQEVDPDRWTTCFWWDDNGCTNLANNEQQWYLPSNVHVTDGSLVLAAREETVTGYEGRSFPYTSGIVTTGRYYREDASQTRFAATYGFFEARLFLPAGQGIWPAFWMLPATLEAKPEIDIMELLGHRPDMLELHFQYNDRAGNPVNVGQRVRTNDLSRDWHVYGLDWGPDRIIWYLDGIEMWRYTDQRFIPDMPMYMILNLAVGGDWPGDADETTHFPAAMHVDYVRAWARKS